MLKACQGRNLNGTAEQQGFKTAMIDVQLGVQAVPDERYLKEVRVSERKEYLMISLIASLPQLLTIERRQALLKTLDQKSTAAKREQEREREQERNYLKRFAKKLSGAVSYIWQASSDRR